MKKIIGLIITIILMIPCIITADFCDNEKHNKYKEYAGNITYENTYSISQGKYTILVYNAINGMYAVYNNQKFYPDESSTIKIGNIPQGSHAFIYIFAEDGCDSQLRTIIENELYYNAYVDSSICKDYENVVKVCTDKFMPYEVTESNVQGVIENYNNQFVATPTPEPVEETFWEKYGKIVFDWFIKAVLLVTTIIISVKIYRDKFINIKHGV